jgi:hypothetical protein
MRTFLFILFSFFFNYGFSQSIIQPVGRTYQINTSGQDASGFAIDGFGSQTLLTSIGLVNPPSGATFTISNPSGLFFTSGYNSWSNIIRISFTGTQENINNALSSLKINTGSSTGNVQISVSVTVNPPGYFYLPSNGHFYRPISWPNGVSGGDAAYNQIKNLASSQTFKGQTGYLVTITSQDEQNFIQSNVPGNNILIALTDRQQEGVWRWDAGPESGTIIKTSNSGGEVSGQYNNWCGGEPNNWGSGENYVVTKWGGGNCWNDFGPPASSFPGSISGYVVEFGTWSNPQDANFADFYVANTTNTIAITNTLTGTVSFPSLLSSPPTLSLFRVVEGSDVFIETKSVNPSGTYSFTLPFQNSTYKLVPSLTVQGVTMDDFNIIFNEVKNINTPNLIQSGLFMTGTKQWKSADMNQNGILDLGDAFLVIGHITGLNPSNKVLWFNPSDYDTITKDNFGSIQSVNNFVINVLTSNVIQNIKYCILGDVNLSHSSQ